MFCHILSRLVLTQPRSSIYIYITAVILQPPCWRYGGDSSTKKIENPKIFYFYMGRIFYLCTHRTSSLTMHKCIYIITVLLRPPCWCYQGGSWIKKDRESKNRVYVFLCFRYFESLSTQTYINLYISVLLFSNFFQFICSVLDNVLRPPCWCYRVWKNT